MKIPILSYHHISNDLIKFGTNKKNHMVCTPSKFEQDMIFIKEKGYKTIFPHELIEKVRNGYLQSNYLLITFDDGYYSFYENAYPILLRYRLKATVGLIVKKVDKNISSAIPKLGWEEIKKAYQSGLVEFQSHSYDMHLNEGCVEKENETFQNYKKRMTADYNASKYVIELEVGNKVYSYIYPFGKYSEWSEIVLKECDCSCTFSTTQKKANVLERDIKSLYCLNRLKVSNSTNLQKLLELDD